jgi:hypothetical protein
VSIGEQYGDSVFDFFGSCTDLLKIMKTLCNTEKSLADSLIIVDSNAGGTINEPIPA